VESSAFRIYKAPLLLHVHETADINKQVLSNCDLLIAIFWTRLGSPTGAALSGTVEEIEEHLAAGKPALIYFSTAPVRMDSVDNDQYLALVDFKKSCQSRGLIEEYEDILAFREKFCRHLAQAVIRHFTKDTVTNEALVSLERKIPKLTTAAQEILCEAAKDDNGAILVLASLDGTHIGTNNREFVITNDARSEAKWRSAVLELNEYNLIDDRAGLGELYFLTSTGYDIADDYKTETANKVTNPEKEYVKRTNRTKDDALEFVRKIPEFQENVKSLSEHIDGIGNYRSTKLESFLGTTGLLSFQHTSGGMHISIPSRLNQLSSEDIQYLVNDILAGDYDHCFFGNG
jgi:hypothetical protein